MIGVMFFGLMVLVLASTIAVMSFAPTALANKHDRGLECEDLAASALNTTFGRLKQEPDFRGTIRVGDERAWAIVTFEPDVARSAAVPVSINSHDQATPATGTLGRTMPANSVQLFARAKVGPETLTVEQVLHAPPFKYCIASSGSVSVNGPMLVAGVKEFDGTLPAQLDPGHMVGNGNVALVGPSTVVSGDVKAAGSVSQGSGVSVQGQVEQQHTAVALPSIEVESYDPGVSNPAARHLDPNYPGLTVDGLARREGDLMLTVSGLELNNGLLYVRGNLVVRGGVSGVGAIICTGNVEIDGGGVLTTSNLAAIVARGNVTITGTGQSSSFFRGLVYTEGNFSARAVTLVGAFVGNSSAPGGCQMQLDQVKAVYDPQAVKFDMKFPFGYSGGPGVGLGASSITPVVPDLSKFYEAATDSYAAKPELLADVQYRYGGKLYSRSRLMKQVRQLSPPDGYSDWTTALDATEADYRDKLTDQLTDIADRYARTRDAALREGKFSLDLNRFLSVTDRLRVVFWRDVN